MAAAAKNIGNGSSSKRSSGAKIAQRAVAV